MITCIAIDDEPRALNVIKNHVSKVDFLELKESFVDPFKAISYLNEHSVDLIFLDINMPDISGFEFLKHLSTKPIFIFTTAHSEYAIQSYEVEAIDYLLKPFDFSRFLLAATKAKNKLSENDSSTVSREFLFLNTGLSKQKVLVDDILYMESDGNYVNYITKNGKLMIRASIKETLNTLPSSHFVQIHRSFIVSLRWVEKIQDNHVYISDKEIPIGNTYKSKLLKLIDQFTG
ncbi:MAG: LytTR family DNA-binding domain-containing protein [Balneolaceae bacterium]